MPAIALDATPLTPYPSAYGGHAVRGIGRYLTAVMRSLATLAPEWTAESLVAIRTADVALPWWSGGEIVTHRARVRPQDVGWLSAPLLDRLAIGPRHLAGWTTTDPTTPLPPPVKGRSAVIGYDLIPLALPAVMAALRPHRRLVYRLYLRRLQRADLVIAISHTVATELTRRLGIAPGRICVVYPGLVAESSVRAPVPNPVAQEVKQRDLLFVGVPAPHKNPSAAVELLIELHRRGHDVRLRFAGTQFPQARRELAGTAARAGVTEFVEYLDHIDDERLAELYRTSVLVAPATIEGLGLGPIEALLAGGAAVCGPAPVFRETLGDAVAYADPADRRSMADAYEHAVENRINAAEQAALAERFGQAACASAAVTAFDRLRSSRRS